MDMNLILWTGGMLFTLGIFATKVGLGLAYGGARRRVVVLTHVVYFALFTTTALICEPLVELIRPVLKSGPYIHILVAIILLVWGAHLLRNGHSTQHGGASVHSLALLIPCPVCFSAVVFSTWTALQITSMSPLLVGVGLGTSFILLASVLHASVRWRRQRADSRSSALALGWVMIAIGSYFLASMIVPGKIQKAKSVFETFNANNEQIGGAVDGTGVFVLLAGVAVLGYFLRRKETRYDQK